MSDDAVGFAIRRTGECDLTEIDCNTTVPGFRACCANAGFCLREKGLVSIYCCPTWERGCRDDVDAKPRCSDSTWDLFRNNGYFCCMPGFKGFKNTKTGTNGCKPPKNILMETEEQLSVISRGQAHTPSGSSTPTSSSSSTLPAERSTDDDGGQPIGAIAGGTVGGVAGLAIVVAAVWWFLMVKRRRKRRRVDDETPKQPHMAALPPEAKEVTPPLPPRELVASDRSTVSQLPDRQGVSELGG